MKNTDIMEALGDVPEDLVLSALHPADDLTAEPDGREQIIMTNEPENKGRTRRLWLRGGIAAAIAGVLLAGNLALLHGLGRIGRSNSSEAETTESTVTTFTETTEQTTETTDTTETTFDWENADHAVTPLLVGMNLEEAKKKARACGLSVYVISTVNDSTAAGTVVWQSYSPGEWHFPGDSISVQVSSGKLESLLNFELRENSYCVVECRAEAFITIPSKYKGLPVTEIAEGAFSDDYMTVVIPNSVTKIGYFCESCTIRGNTGSYAEAYAKEHQIEFISDSISCGESHYQMIDNSLYRIEDNKKLFTVDQPQQYLQKPAVDADSIVVKFEEITDVGDGWYFLAGTAEDPLNASGNNEYLHVFSYIYFWFNETTGELKPALFSAEERDILHAEYLKKEYSSPWNNLLSHSTIYPDPDGGAVYTLINHVPVRIPVPGNGKLSAFMPNQCDGFYGFNMVPLHGGKVLILSVYSDKDDNGLYEMDISGKTTRFLTDQFIPQEIIFTGNRYICLDNEAKKLLEYSPESNSFKTIAAFKTNSWYELDSFTEDSVHLCVPEDPYDAPDLLVSLKDGKVTELK